MTEITHNPMGFTCASNAATPDYVIYDDFKMFVAYGLVTCWLSSDSSDPDADCYMARPVTREDVHELRGYFLDLLECAIFAYWDNQAEKGGNWLGADPQTIIIGNSDENPDEEETNIEWSVRFDDDAMMFLMGCTKSDDIAIWLGYKGLNDRKKVLEVLTEARAADTGYGDVWEKLAEQAALDIDYDEMMIEVRDLQEMDLVDLQSCPQISKDDHPTIEFEYATVSYVRRESKTRIAVGFEGITEIGLDPSQKLKTRRREYNEFLKTGAETK